jgi:hypothetical protein
MAVANHGSLYMVPIIKIKPLRFSRNLAELMTRFSTEESGPTNRQAYDQCHLTIHHFSCKGTDTADTFQVVESCLNEGIG